jgi:hypothetical protein
MAEKPTPPGGGSSVEIQTGKEELMSRRARKRRDRKKGGANHGKRPNA